MNQRQYTLTILPDETTLTGREGDNLYTLLLLAGLVERGNPRSEQLCLERGAVSPADQPEAEAAVFTAAQRTEGWLLASQRHVTGDAVLRRGEDQPECTSMEEAEPLSRGYGLAFDLGTSTIAAGLVDLASINIPQLTAGPNRQTALAPRLEDRQALARTEAGRQQLRGQLIEDMQDLITKLSLPDRRGAGPDHGVDLRRQLSDAGSAGGTADGGADRKGSLLYQYGTGPDPVGTVDPGLSAAGGQPGSRCGCGQLLLGRRLAA